MFAARVTHLPKTIATQLDAAGARAPYRVRRWVAWGSTNSEQTARLELVLHLRATLGGERWASQSEIAAAWAELRDRPGLRAAEIQPAPYRAVIARAAAAKVSGRRLTDDARARSDAARSARQASQATRAGARWGARFRRGARRVHGRR
jgi:hypothetical protein